jgi:hypothetical protein
MMLNILVFLMVLSIVYLLRFVSEFVIKLFSDEPSIMQLSQVDKTFLYLSISYIITFIIRWPNV